VNVRRTGTIVNVVDDFSPPPSQPDPVAVVPGTAFGAGGEGHIRCSYATALPKLEEALERMERFVQTLPGVVPTVATGVAG